MYYFAIVTGEDDFFCVEFMGCVGCCTFAHKDDNILSIMNEALEGWLESSLDFEVDIPYGCEYRPEWDTFEQKQFMLPTPGKTTMIPVKINDKLANLIYEHNKQYVKKYLIQNEPSVTKHCIFCNQIIFTSDTRCPSCGYLYDNNQ